MFKKKNQDSLFNYTLLKKLGKGSYGTVYLAKSNKNEKNVVIKKIDISQCKKQKYNIDNEVSFLQQVSHQRITQIYSSFTENNKLYIVMEYASNGDLYQYTKKIKQQKKTLDEKVIWKIAIQIFEALQYIHQQNIIHRDIKPQNIFLDDDLNIKIGDFGVSKLLDSFKKNDYTKVGTPLYISPELVQNNKYDYKVDIWSTGCVLYYLAAQKVPFWSENLLALGNQIVYKNPEPLKNISNSLQNLIFQCLNKQSSLRPDSTLCLEICKKQHTKGIENLQQKKNQGKCQIIQQQNPIRNKILLSDLRKMKQIKFQSIQKENDILNIQKSIIQQKQTQNTQKNNIRKTRILSASASKLIKKINDRNSNLKFKAFQDSHTKPKSIQRIQSANQMHFFKVTHKKYNQIQSLQNFPQAQYQKKSQKQQNQENFVSFYFQNYLAENKKCNLDHQDKKNRPSTAMFNPQKNMSMQFIQRPQSALNQYQNFRICQLIQSKNYLYQIIQLDLNLISSPPDLSKFCIKVLAATYLTKQVS